MQVALLAVELYVELQLAEADWAERFFWHSTALKATICAVHCALKVDAVLEPEHVTNLVHHGPAGALHPLDRCLLLRHAGLHPSPVPVEREYTALVHW